MIELLFSIRTFVSACVLIFFLFKMAPRPKLTHDDYRKKVCLLCFNKTKKMFSLTDSYRHTIEKYIKPGLSVTDPTLPTALCHSCYTAVNERQRDIWDRKIHLFNHSTLSKLKPITRNSPDCDCRVCVIAKDRFHGKPPVGRPETAPVKETTVLKKCSFCLTQIGKGKLHQCTKGTRYANLRKIIDSPDDMTGEVIAANILKSKCNQVDNSCISLKQEKGRPLRVKVSPP